MINYFKKVFLLFSLFIFFWINLSFADDYIYYYWNSCPHCEEVSLYIENEDISEKINIIKKEVYDNSENRKELLWLWETLWLALSDIWVPFLYDSDNKNYYSWKFDIIEFLDSKNEALDIVNTDNNSYNTYTKKWYKLVWIKGYEIYYWLESDWLSYISYNWKIFGWFDDIPYEPILTDDWKVIMVWEKNWDFIIILDWEIIFNWKKEDLKIENGDNETTFYANWKKYILIDELQDNLGIMTSKDFSNLKLDNSFWNQKENNKIIVNWDKKSEYIRLKSLSYEIIKQLNQEKYITQIDKIVNLSKKEKLEVVYNKIQKLKIENYVISYLESVIYLKLVENQNSTEDLNIKNN